MLRYFDAQHLLRTLAIAVEAANTQKRKLILADSPCLSLRETTDDSNEMPTNPWLQDIPILPSQLSVGTNDLRGRTVQLSRVIGRWCQFCKLEDLT